MKISVITVCHNAAKTLEATIESIASQSYSMREHIIVDGNSRDGTREILERNRRMLTRVVSEPDDGIYDAMNKGIGLATGDVIGFLNADDSYAHPDVLAHIAAQFRNPQIEACYADLVYVDKDDLQRIVRYWKSRDYADGLFETGWMPAHPTFYARREVYARCGGYDTQYRLQADFEFTLRALAIHHVRTEYVPEIWVKMRTGGATNSTVSNVICGNLEAYHAARKHGLAVTPLFMLRKVISRIPQYFRKPG